MARSEARLSTSIWNDGDFRALNMAGQWAYALLISQPDLSHLGVLPYRPRRWARAARGLTAEMVDLGIAELVAGRFVVVDEETEEVLVRSLMRRDGVYRQPNILRAAEKDLVLVESEEIRRVLAVEVSRISEADDIPAGSKGLLARMSEGLPDPSAEPFAGPPGDLRPEAAEPVEAAVANPSPKGSANPSAGPDPNPSPGTTGERGVVTTVSTDSPIPLFPAPPSPPPGGRAPAAGKPAAEERPELQRLCEMLADRIQRNGSKRPAIGKGWLDAVRLMIDTDKRSIAEIERLIDWSQRDSFWKSNILSMPKLRDKFDTLRLKAEAESTSGNSGPWRNPEDQSDYDDWNFDNQPGGTDEPQR